MSENTFYQILSVLSPVLMAFVGWVSVKLAGYIKAKTQNEKVGGMLVRLSTSVLSLVREADQTIVDEVRKAKDPASPGGNSLTPEEADLIRDQVVAKFKTLWGTKGLDELRAVLGVEGESIDKLIVSKIEEAVKTEKREEARVSIPPPPPRP